MSKKSICTLIAVVILLAVIAACAPAPTPVPPTVAPKPTDAPKPAEPTKAPAAPTTAPAQPTKAPEPTKAAPAPTAKPTDVIFPTPIPGKKVVNWWSHWANEPAKVIEQIVKDYEAARIDGCGDLRMFWQVMLPLARPAVATVILINFMHFWNELLALTMVTQPEMRTIQVAMMNFVGEHGSDYAIAAASLVTSMLPVLILYIVLSDKFIEGMTAGAVKG
jgi:hypothetical protein